MTAGLSDEITKAQYTGCDGEGNELLTECAHGLIWEVAKKTLFYRATDPVCCWSW